MNMFQQVSFWLLSSVLVSAVSANEIKLYVSPVGDDTHSGTSEVVVSGSLNGPVKSVSQAQLLARGMLSKMRGGNVPIQPIRILLASGEYPLLKPLLFEPADSGFADAPVSYEAAVAGTATLTGGSRLVSKLNSGSLMSYHAPPGQVLAILGGSQLFVQGQRATLARTPDVGSYWFVDKPVAMVGEQGDLGREAFLPEKAAFDFLASIPVAERGRAIVNVMNSWSAGRHRLSDGAPPGTVRIRPAGRWPFLKFGQNQRYFVENVSAAFDKPGEWYWNADEILYRPKSTETGALIAVLPVLDKLLEVRGQPEKNQWVSNLWFKGIVFSHTRSLTPSQGFFDVQAAVAVGAAIEVDGARNLRFEGVEVSQTGGYGIWLRTAVRDSAVIGSVFTDLGAGAIKLGLASQLPSDLQGTGNNKLLGNKISETGKLYPGAVAVWVGQSFDNEVSYNTIANTSYSGISVGWKWGYGEVRSGRNKIIGNLLFNIGQGNLDDMGAIYHLGMAPGTVISNNLIREVRAYKGYGPGGWGIYLDEGSSNMTVTNNVVVGSDSGGMHLHYGRSNSVLNNVFAGGEDHELLVSRSDPALTLLTFKDNLLIPMSGSVLAKFAMAPDVVLAGNRVSASLASKPLDLVSCGGGCSVSQARLTTGVQPRAVVLSGADTSMIQLVERVAAQAGKLPADVQLASGSVLNVVPTADLLVATQKPELARAVRTGFSVDFNLTANDARPLELNYLPKDDKRALRVVRGGDIPGGACMMFDDGPQFANRYEPHAYANINFETGEVVGKFSLKFDPASQFIYEWRDAGKPFQTGPLLQISAKGLETHSRLLAKLNPGQWYDFEITAALGDKAGVWRVAVSDGKTGPMVFDNLPVKTKGWKQLKWLGFISDAMVKSEACAAQIGVSLKP